MISLLIESAKANTWIETVNQIAQDPKQIFTSFTLSFYCQIVLNMKL